MNTAVLSAFISVNRRKHPVNATYSAKMMQEGGMEVPALRIDALLRKAIEQRRLIRFNYKDKPRIVEPHDYGVHKGSVKLFGYQVGGLSSEPLSVQNTAVGARETAQRKIGPSSSGNAPGEPAEGNRNGQDHPISQPMDPFLDSDGDGLPDWFEILIGTDPFNPDTDGDGLTDFQEVFIYHTNPLKPDTDGDGFTDGEEVRFGSDPLDPNSTPLNIRKQVAAVPPNPADLAKSVRDVGPNAADGTESKATIEGDPHVKSRSRKQKREKAGSREGNSSGTVPRANR